ncbi:MAG: isoprenyl transferase [Bacteroidales bacterium]|nr:isoprenyl transferase [Bacteroidales bacterium]
MELKDQINKDNLPHHVAVIMDGNGRWARNKGKHRVQGHRNGVKSVREVTEAAAELGIDYLTLYAFSTENWNRPREEIDALMSLLVTSLNSETKTLMKNNIRLLVIGDLKSLPTNVLKKLNSVIEKTSQNTGMSLVLALSYSARWEIVDAARKLSEDVKSGEVSVNDIDNNLFNKYLNTSDIPDPDILIRTSGEYRISNFLLWQIAYSELYFTDTLWPDFRKDEFYNAILNFQNRERRFGKTSEQVKI